MAIRSLSSLAKRTVVAVPPVRRIYLILCALLIGTLPLCFQRFLFLCSFNTELLCWYRKG